jgi:hypothetical protein
VGKENIVFTFTSESGSYQIKVQDVYHVSDFKYNLLSRGQLTKSLMFINLETLLVNLKGYSLSSIPIHQHGTFYTLNAIVTLQECVLPSILSLFLQVKPVALDL